MDIREIRHTNVRILVRRLEVAAGKSGDRAGGLAMLAAKLGKSSGQVAHFASSEPIKPIGDVIARQIEEAFGLEHGWMDWLHDENGELATPRLVPAMVAETHAALRRSASKERPYQIEEDPARFVRLYERRASLSAHPTQEEWVQFGRDIQAIVAQGTPPHGPNDGNPPHGHHPKGVAGRVRKSA